MTERHGASARPWRVVILLAGSLLFGCGQQSRGHVVLSTSTPFVPAADLKTVRVHAGDESWSQTYFASVGPASVKVLNVLLISPEATVAYDTDRRTFETTLDYTNARNSPTMLANAVYWRVSLGLESFVYLPAPGTFGSGGPIAAQHQRQGADALNDALDEIKSIYNATYINLAGQSSMAGLAAAMIAGREDLRCVVLASGPYDQSRLIAERGWPSTYLGVVEPFSLENIVSGVKAQMGRRISILYDRHDRIVPPDQSEGLYAGLKSANVGFVSLQEAEAKDLHHHDLTTSALRVFASCGDA